MIKSMYNKIWYYETLVSEFLLVGFCGGYALVTRKADGAQGYLSVSGKVFHSFEVTK